MITDAGREKLRVKPPQEDIREPAASEDDPQDALPRTTQPEVKPSTARGSATRSRRRERAHAPIVDSPRGKRAHGYRPTGDTLFTADAPDPYDEKVLITVKEAAWMLSLPEHAIRQAVTTGDLDRVFIGDGGRNYRIVYGSLLGWVNSMPRESAHRRWW